MSKFDIHTEPQVLLDEIKRLESRLNKFLVREYLDSVKSHINWLTSTYIDRLYSDREIIIFASKDIMSRIVAEIHDLVVVEKITDNYIKHTLFGKPIIFVDGTNHLSVAVRDKQTGRIIDEMAVMIDE